MSKLVYDFSSSMRSYSGRHRISSSWNLVDDWFVETEYGIVGVEQYKNDWGAYLRFVKDGICYSRHHNKKYSYRYLVTLAKRFAKEIGGQNANR